LWQVGFFNNGIKISVQILMKSIFRYNIALVLLLLASFGCKKQEIASVVEVAEKEVITAKETFLKTDTISISANEKGSKDDFILAHLLEKTADKDSLVTAHYRLDFYKNKTKLGSEKVTIFPYTEGSDWSAFYGISEEVAATSPFIQIDFGYPACAYNHQQYLFYLSPNSVQLVHEWESMTDSGWGSWLEFINVNPNNKTDSFYCKSVSYSPTDDETGEMGTVEYSDSTKFYFKNKRWNKQQLSTKGKPYFRKKVAFDVFHNQN
jgi:hypothetical protein